MKDISYHILDIANNSITAGASVVEIEIAETSDSGEYILTVADNGCGMTEEMAKKALDPFVTSSVTKKVGLGLPLLKQNAELTGGSFSLKSVEQEGTRVRALFKKNHIDMIPEGDLVLSLRTLIAVHPEIDFRFACQKDDRTFELDTSEIRRELEGIPLNQRDVLEYLEKLITDNLMEIKK